MGAYDGNGGEGVREMSRNGHTVRSNQNLTLVRNMVMMVTLITLST